MITDMCALITIPRKWLTDEDSLLPINGCFLTLLAIRILHFRDRLGGSSLALEDADGGHRQSVVLTHSSTLSSKVLGQGECRRVLLPKKFFSCLEETSLSHFKYKIFHSHNSVTIGLAICS